MTLQDIANLRLSNQQVVHTHYTTPKKLVSFMGAIQAQDYRMAKLAIATRLPTFSDEKTAKAFNRGDILRTHVLRPTWHYVSSEDIRWMLELTAPRIKSSMKSRYKELGMTANLITKSNNIICELLAGKKYLTRGELKSELERMKIDTGNNRLSHLLLYAELEMFICSGPVKNNRQTYALLEERTTQTNTLSREESLEKLALIYFTSHGPAALDDFIWWSGLLISDAKKALNMVKKKLGSDIVDGRTYWFSKSASFQMPAKPSVYFLPAFDEFIISYKNRSATLTSENHKKAVSTNGLFKPVIVFNGQVIGIWKPVFKKGTATIETDFFQPVNKTSGKLIDEKIEEFTNYLNKRI